MNELIKEINADVLRTDLPDFGPGDTVIVNYKIREGNKERVQPFQGTVLQIRNAKGISQSFTVRKISEGIGVERIFPMHSPNIASVSVVKRGRVRRARIFYLRKLSGKRARIQEKRTK